MSSTLKVTALLRRFRNRFKPMMMPQFKYNGQMARVKYGGDEVSLVGAHYNQDFGTYMYWANINGTKVVIPETYLEDI